MTRKEYDRREAAALTNRFLKNGGEIKQCPTGAKTIKRSTLKEALRGNVDLRKSTEAQA